MTERPDFADIDAWGDTHVGKVRTENQDHYFLGALARGVTVERTSIEPDGEGKAQLRRLASLAVVADGVGGSGGGEQAARRAVRSIVGSVTRFYHEAELKESKDPDVFSRLLLEATLAVHEELLEAAEQDQGGRRFATTLTLFLGLWPHAYLLQVGDSRCYVYYKGELRQISRDQTLAQELVDSGALTQTMAEKSKWANVLSSAVGGGEAAPVVTRLVRDWGTVVLLCSDGLTKHVSDEQIKERLANLTSSKEAVELLMADALEGGGTDNITLIVGRTVPPHEHEAPDA